MPALTDLLDTLSATLVRPGVPPARAQARDLIAWVLDKPRFWPSANPDYQLSDPELQAIQQAAEKLKAGMPLQYAVGKAPFRHLTLSVTPDTLIPRPETELLVELVIAAQSGGKGTVVDVGTGSGAVALAAESAFEQVIATDISDKALAVARENLTAIPEDRRPRLDVRPGDLLAPLHGQTVEAVVSNPPIFPRRSRPNCHPSSRTGSLTWRHALRTSASPAEQFNRDIALHRRLHHPAEPHQHRHQLRRQNPIRERHRVVRTDAHVVPEPEAHELPLAADHHV